MHRHHKFEHGGKKYAADMESEITVEINEVEWELLNRDFTETLYATVEDLKSQFTIEQIFEGVERLQRLSRRGLLLSPIGEAKIYQQSGEKLKLFVPLQFVQEQAALDTITNENRYHLLTSLSKYANLETIKMSDKLSSADFGEFVAIRDVKTTETEPPFPLPWHAMDDYDGILLLSQFLWHDILYYPQDVPVLHCLESDRKLQGIGIEKVLEHSTAQKPTDLLLPKVSWLADWLTGFGVDPARMHVISEGISVVESIDKTLAKRYTASLTENPLFAKQPVVGIISGFKPNIGIQVISELATSNSHLTFFVYDSILSKRWRNPPNNVIIFSADDDETRAVLPIFFQALDLVCFPAIPGTSASLVLESMAYGTSAVVISQYGLPPEIEEAGALVQCPPNTGNDLKVPVPQVSKMINQLLKGAKRREKYEQIAKGFAAKYTWERTAQEIVQLFQQSTTRAQGRQHPALRTLSRPIFCRYYDPRTVTTYPSAYRQETNRFEPLEDALAEVLSKHHTSAEVEVVFEHFQRK